jgi:hypothetical protein
VQEFHGPLDDHYDDLDIYGHLMPGARDQVDAYLAAAAAPSAA